MQCGEGAVPPRKESETMNQAAYVALAIFVVVYVLIISEKVQRTVIALCGAALMVLLGILTQDKAIAHIDFNTLGLLIGMMAIVNITAETGLFRFLAIWAAKKVKASPVKLLVAVAVLTGVCSGFLDNVTTVLLTVPITFDICSRLKVPVYPFLLAQIMASNIGGTATLIGDPPNVMIGSAVPELDFGAFLANLGPICLLILLVTLGLLALLYKKQLKTKEEYKAQVMGMDERVELHNLSLLKKCLFVLVLVICGFIFHSQLGVETATVALAGAALLMLISIPGDENAISNVLSHVEWTAIFFFIGLFVVIGGLVETGVIDMLARDAVGATAGDTTAATFLILWLSAIASAFVDNIPFVATMIPLIQDMGQMGMSDLTPLWWALSLGACLGGNGTLIGASANVVVAGLARQKGINFTFRGYTKIGFPLMLLAILLCSGYLWLLYL